MPGLLRNATNISITDIEYLSNTTSFPEFLVKINETVFNGVFWFVMLWTIWVLLFMTFQKVRDQPLNNIMYSGAIVTILSFLIRGVNVLISGVSKGLLTDHQMWIFPIITLVVVIIVWSTKQN